MGDAEPSDTQLRKELCYYVAQIYREVADQLPAERGGCCVEAACLALGWALAVGLEADLQTGYRRGEDGNVSWHAWAKIGDRYFDSPRRGVVRMSDGADLEPEGTVAQVGRVHVQARA